MNWRAQSTRPSRLIVYVGVILDIMSLRSASIYNITSLMNLGYLVYIIIHTPNSVDQAIVLRSVFESDGLQLKKLA